MIIQKKFLSNLKERMESTPSIPEGWLYIGDSEERYVLGQPGRYNVLVLGVNPNTATPKDDDPTVRKVREIVKNNGYDGWIMMNLYPLISTDPASLPKVEDKKLVDKNLMVIKAVVESYTIGAVWAAWGNTIDTRFYLGEGLGDIMEATGDIMWYTCGNMTKQGNPRHPLYVKKDEKFDWFPVFDYSLAWMY